jgi:hypothetical protein
MLKIMYTMNMPKQAISVTLDQSNVLWLRGQAGAAEGRGSVSEVVDRLITEARTGGKTHEAAIRSVVGTIDLASDDPLLDQADAFVRAHIETSLQRPFLVRERATASSAHRKARIAKSRRRG